MCAYSTVLFEIFILFEMFKIDKKDKLALWLRV